MHCVGEGMYMHMNACTYLWLFAAVSTSSKPCGDVDEHSIACTDASSPGKIIYFSLVCMVQIINYF